MTRQFPESREHIGELLPAFLNGRLDEAELDQVHEHLLSCEICQQELAAWRSIKEAAGLLQVSMLQLPSATPFMSAVWAKIDDPAPAVQVSWLKAPQRALSLFWQVLRAQFPLIHKSTWFASALVCLLGLCLALIMASHSLGQKLLAGNMLVLFINVVGASGCAYIYGASVDPGFEWTLAMPVSVRVLLFCRMGIVLGYNLLLGMFTSAVFVTITGGGLWEMVHLWLGPLFFLSSLCLTLSLFVGSTFAIVCTAIIGGLQHLPGSLAPSLIPPINISPDSPLLLFAALLLIIVAACCTPRQPRLAS